MKVNRKVLPLAGIFLFSMSLVIVGILMYFKMNHMSINYVQTQVATQAEIQAKVIEEEFSAEIKDLELLSKYIQLNKMDWSLLAKIAEDSEDKICILKLNGTAAFGEYMSPRTFSGIQHSFHGNNGVSFSSEKGLVFSTPIRNGQNVKYVLCRVISPENIQKKFRFEAYSGNGRADVISKNGEKIFSDSYGGFYSFLNQKNVKQAFDKIQEAMTVASSGACISKIENKNCIFYASEIGSSDFLLIGEVPVKFAGMGLASIGYLFLWVFGLLFLLFIICMIFILGEEKKIGESEALREAKVAAEKANSAKSDFLANMSHEIRTPINAVMGMNEMILRECTDENIISYSRDIQSASQNLLSIINDILDFSKIEAGKMEIVEVSYELCSLLNDVANMINVKAKQKKLGFEINADTNLPTLLFGDPIRIQQVIINLLTNGVKYTNEGTVSLFMNEINRADGETILVIKVTDTGIGIKPEDMEKLFGSFQRLDLSKNRNVEGTGLGLAITAKLIHQMKGEIQVESEYGKGTTFTVRLPQKIVDDTPIGDFKSRFENSKKQQSQKGAQFIAPEAKVLVVDDNAMNLQVVKNLLKHTQIQVSTCTSGKKCLELIQKERFDIVLLDHMMPEMDGIETLKAAKELEFNKCANTPFIALTANAIVGVREMYIEAGFNDYLSKPIEVKLLEKMLIYHLPEKLVQRIDVPEEEDSDKIMEKVQEQSEEIGKELEKGEKITSCTDDSSSIDRIVESVVVSAETTESDESQTDEQLESSSKVLIDTSVGLNYCADDKEMYIEILKVYDEESQPNIEKLEKFLAEKDCKNYSILAHAMKSASYTIGAQAFGDLAKSQEFAGKEERFDDMMKTHESFIEGYKEILEKVRELVKKGDV